MKYGRKLTSQSGLFASLLVVLAVGALKISAAEGAQGGYTNYVPGFYGSFGVAAPLEPGFYMLNDFYYYSADGSKGRVIQGTQVEADLDMDFGGYVLTGFMVTDKELFGGRYGFGADLPIIYGSISGQFDAAAESFAFDDSRFVIGDPGVIPISLFWNFGNFHLNAYESIIVPIGQYDQDELINGGLNYWSFDTVVAGTYLHPDMGFELSAAIGYIFNTENQDIDYKTGQEFHLDYNDQPVFLGDLRGWPARVLLQADDCRLRQCGDHRRFQGRSGRHRTGSDVGYDYRRQGCFCDGEMAA